MQNIDNNMDDLYRKAAEQYEPAPGENNWPAIRARLSSSSTEVVVAARKKSSLKRNLLLLLLFAFATTDYFYQHSNNVSTKQTAATTSATVQKNKVVKSVFTSNYLLASNEVKPGKHPEIKRNDVIDNKLFFHSLNASVKSFSPIDLNTKTLNSIASDKDKNNETPQSHSDSEVAFDKEKEEVISDLPKADSNRSAQSKTHNLNKKESRFYVGVLAGLSINQVQHQGYRKAAQEVGLLAGYKINKRLSVEAGLQYDKKYYFSDGKYFSMEKMPANMKVLSLNGCSHVIEIPLIAKYDIVKTKKAAAFVSAGVSSYLLTKESNQYVAMVNSEPQNVNGLYRQVSGGFVSSFHIGFGFEKTISKSVAIRIEPYANIPVKGIGIGNMRVMTAGLHVAFSLPVH